MQTVAGNKAAIGYISLGSLDNTVKAVKVDGVEATADNVKNGTYPICRPFNIATKGDLSDAAKDFIAFIQSDEGQQVVTDKGCVSTGSPAPSPPAIRPAPSSSKAPPPSPRSWKSSPRPTWPSTAA